MPRSSATRLFSSCFYALCATLVALACSCSRATYSFTTPPLAGLAAAPTAPQPTPAGSSAGQGTTQPGSPATAARPRSRVRGSQRHTRRPAPAPGLVAPTTPAPSRAGVLVARLLTRRLLPGKLQPQPAARTQHKTQVAGGSTGLVLLVGGALLVAIAAAVSTSLAGAILGTLLLLLGIILALVGLLLLLLGAAL